MECIAVFSGWSAGKGKDGAGGGLSTLSGMAVAGHGDALVSASGRIQRTPWLSSTVVDVDDVTVDKEATTIKS